MFLFVVPEASRVVSKTSKIRIKIMKIKFEMVVTRSEYAAVIKHMVELMDRIHSHMPMLEREMKGKVKSSMLKDLNNIPGISVKSKNRFGGYMFMAGLKDDIVLEIEIEANIASIDAMFDVAGVLTDIAGPFLNAAMLVSKGSALKELKSVYDMYTRQSKPSEFSIVRNVAQFEEK